MTVHCPAPGVAATEVDVLVVGAGPVGLAMAAALGREAVSTLVIDRGPTLNTQPRAVHFDGETSRFFQALGIGDMVARLSMRVEGMNFVDESGEVIFAVAYGEGDGPQGWPQASLFHQPDLERILAERVDQGPTTRRRMSTTLVSLRGHARGVAAATLDASSQESTVTARYVVGCDGAGSTVRRLIGSDWVSAGSSQPWLVVDGRLRVDDGSLPSVPEQRPWPKRPQFFMRNVGGRVRWEFRVMPEDDAETLVDRDSVDQLISESIDPAHVEVERAVVYTFRSLLASRWRSQSVFLAGDAAHLQPPFMAQGLCSGLRDVSNLSWKLAQALRTDDDRLLDTYESERRPHAEAWVREATRVADLCQEIDAQAAATRNDFLRAHSRSLEPIVPGLGHGLHGDSPWPAGTLSEQCRLNDGRRMDDEIGRRWAVLADVEQDVPSLPEDVAHLSGDRHAEVRDFLATLSSSYAVIRPDGYLLGVAGDRAALQQVLDRILRPRRFDNRPTATPSQVGLRPEPPHPARPAAALPFSHS